MKIKVIFSALLLIYSSSNATENHPHWGYKGEENPENWGKLSPNYSLCETGKNQSPVNIHGALTALNERLNFTFNPGVQEVLNTGYTIQVNTGAGNLLHLDNDAFTLQQFHFHAPGENEIEGKQYPLEAHFVYKNAQGALAVVALMFREGKGNPQLDNAWEQIPTEAKKIIVLDKAVDISTLIPTQSEYYRFSGSLTTPPCSEGVRWLVLKDIASVSSGQINHFRTVISYDNNRPIQPLNGRVIVN
ncbi:carbonic anhydrase [Erwinia sorbitola]|uniref:carbonic anhydrase n=1 Tax=Erwinia sorbitola TaxID=2681984 RepID=A0A6I6EG77_9GAMM|nr:carbonic anhydrase family protein [Erwinia sorbitola]QGU87578.1 carbonic anhydrase [Erwinia sorbitola]